MRPRGKWQLAGRNLQQRGKKLPQAAMRDDEAMPVRGIVEPRGTRALLGGQQRRQGLALCVRNIQGKCEEPSTGRRLRRDGEVPALRIDQRAMPARRGSSVFSASVL